ncbi:MAG: response regulator [Eubacteriales bacterium]|nr:response regulator [Eubacteriales bacterium]
MKYKILLTGKNNTVIDDFFTQMGESFETLTTSGRNEDIMNHLTYFKPDIFVYCPNHESNENNNLLFTIKGQLERDNIPVVLIGSEEDCKDLSQSEIDNADLVLHKPITASSIRNRIMDYMEEQKRLRGKAARAEEERLAQEKAALAEADRLAREKAAQKKHILVVDDDPLMLKLIKEHLREDYNVATATSGKTAFRFLRKKKTDLILLDYAMPEEDGPAVLEKLHADDATRDIPVVFLTGVTDRNKIQKALVQKPQGYLLKPIDRDKLIETIAKLIG